MATNYYAVLGLQEGADDAEIRRAFRTLVKRFHPDLNPSPDARERFMEVHEAYEYLSDPDRKAAFDARYARQRLSDEERARREYIWKRWVEYQQQEARARAEYYAAHDFDDYEKTRWYSVAMGISKVYNVLFLMFCAAVIAIPIFKYIQQWDLPEDDQKSIAFFLVPVIAGLIFAGWGYYYWFILKHDER